MPCIRTWISLRSTHAGEGYVRVPQQLQEQIMDVWKSESNSGKQIALSVACAITGLVLMFSFRDFRNFGTNALAGFMLGALLLIIGIWNVLVSGKQTITVDPKTCRIIVEDSYGIAAKRRSIPFSDVIDVSIGYLGKKSNAVTWYYLVLKLTNGKDFSLFSPGRFYEGGSDRPTVERWRRRLEEYIGQSGAQ
jgi:hypothetical protein